MANKIDERAKVSFSAETDENGKIKSMEYKFYGSNVNILMVLASVTEAVLDASAKEAYVNGDSKFGTLCFLDDMQDLFEQGFKNARNKVKKN